MMKILECNDYEFNQIKNGLQLFKIFDFDYSFEFLEKCKLKNKKDNEIINIQITSINKYSDIVEMLKVINIEKFGVYVDEKDFVNFINDNYKIDKEFFVCRIKNLDEKMIDITDKELLKLIKVDTLKKFTLGLSGCQVYGVKSKDNKDAILKIQAVSGADSLEEEYKVLKFLNGKIRIAIPYYYSNTNNTEYLLRECLDGEPLYKYRNFGFKIGKELRNIHKLLSKEISFNKFCTDNLLKNALEKIEIVYQTRSMKFIDYTKEELIEFLIANKPDDDALVHGDFSLTNILVQGDDYYYIDLGNVSISTKYFDIYVFKKSLKINKLEDELNDFIKGYGLNKIEEIYMDWMSLVESSYN